LDRIGLLERSEAVARAKDVFSSLDKIIETPDDLDTLHDFFRNSAGDLAQVARQHREDIERYLRQEGLLDGGHRIIIDLGWRGSLQRSLVDLLRARKASTVLSGLYYGLTRDAGVNRGSAGWMQGMIGNDFMDAASDFRLRQMATILEQLHSADHGSVWGYSAEGGRITPVFRTNGVEQRQYAECILPFQAAATSELRRIFQGKHPLTTRQLDANSAWAALVDLCLYPSPDEARMIGGLRHMDGFEHSGEGVPIAALLPRPSREEAEAALRGHTWIAGSLRNWFAAHPGYRDILRDIARQQNFESCWLSQFQ